MCSPNRYQFSKKVFLFAKRVQIFQEDMSVRRTDTIFPGTLFMCSPNNYRFSRSAFLATEQIQIFQDHFFLATEQIMIFQERLFSYRTDNDFQEAFFEYQRTDRQFPGRYPPPNRKFRKRFRWLLSCNTARNQLFCVKIHEKTTKYISLKLSSLEKEMFKRKDNVKMQAHKPSVHKNTCNSKYFT